jgi:hypothetical protein
MPLISIAFLFAACFSALYTFAYWYDSAEGHTVVKDPEQRQRMRARFKKQLPITIVLIAAYIATFYMFQ